MQGRLHMEHPMPALTTYTDFLLATKTHKITGANDILNDAVKQTYLLSEMLKGRDHAEIVRTGSRIKDTIKLTDSGSFEFYVPNATFTPQDRDTLTDVTIDWRFAVVNHGFADETISLNEGNSEDIFVNLKKKMNMDCKTDMMNGMEDALFDVPDAATMENGMGAMPPANSIMSFISEDTTNFHPPGYTTIMGVDPANEEGWRPQVTNFDSANPGDDAQGLFAAFDEMFLDVRFESPDSNSEYFENDRLRKMKILTNKDGHTLYKRLLRAGNDSFQDRQDPEYNNPRYAGIPVKYITALNTRNLDFANGTPWATGQPRFIWLNLMYLFPIFHTRGYMQQVGPIAGGINQPFAHAVYYRNWYNLFCRSRKRQGIVAPL